MAMAERRARIVWQGPLRTGSGELQFVSSGIGTYPVTWASRVERPDGRTNPEELLAASHAACYAMAFNATLADGGHPPQRLDVTATVSLDRKEGGRIAGHRFGAGGDGGGTWPGPSPNPRDRRPG